MTSVRVPGALLDTLHQARPQGRSLAAVIQRAVELAGGPGAVKASLEIEDRRAGARARVARLRRSGHRSVVLAPDQQVALAEAIGDWCDLLEARGQRRYAPETRRLVLRPDRQASGTGSPRLRLSRGGQRL